MRNTGLVAFAVTVGILAPVVVLQLSAGPKQRQMLFAPGSNSLSINGVHIDATLDRFLVDPGESVHLDLTAPNRVEVGIVVLGSSGSEGARVPDPPIGVLEETVSLEPNVTKHVALQLHGARNTYDLHANYTIYVMSTKAAAKLARTQRRAGPSIPTGDIPEMDGDTQKLFTLTYEIGRDDIENASDAAMFGSTAVARFEAYTRAANPSISIEAPETAQVDAPTAIAVVLKNPSGHRQHVKVELTFPQFDDAYLGLPYDAVIAEKSDDVIELARGETKRVVLHVTAKRAGLIGVGASVECVEGGRECLALYRGGAFEAVQILSGPPAVATRK